jgi:predicted negative regulator of RcsB-dependent stress response
MAGMKNILIGALIAGVAVLGYLYYQNRQSTIEIKLPNVSIEKK